MGSTVYYTYMAWLGAEMNGRIRYEGDLGWV